jgi:hypothetical protein
LSRKIAEKMKLHKEIKTLDVHIMTGNAVRNKENQSG